MWDRSASSVGSVRHARAPRRRCYYIIAALSVSLPTALSVPLPPTLRGMPQHGDSSLPEIVLKKLAMPGAALQPSQSRECLVGCIKHGKTIARRAEGKRTVVVLGNTGAGKSAFINLLHGCIFAYEDDDKMVVRSDSPLAELMRIGHSNTSETFSPQVEDATSSIGAGYAFADCPGFLDNRGFEINVANAVNVRHTVAAASSAVVVVVVNFYSLRADRGKGLRDLLSILLGLFGSVERVKEHAPSVLLAISHCPVHHPETGEAMTLARYREALLDPDGLDETTGEVLKALLDVGDNVCIFHLLGRGGSSWLSREQIISRVRSLPPMAEPTSLFQSVLSDSDKEKLRSLVGSLGADVRALLSEATPAAYASAASLVSDLLELRLIEHGFVAGLVEKEVREAVEERMAAVVALIDGLFLQGGAGFDGVGVEGADGARAAAEEEDDARRLEEARAALKSVRAMLDAFATVDSESVRMLLQRLVAEAAGKLETAETRRAEAQGRLAMAETLREALRSVGAHLLGPNYNVVREVLALPAVIAAAREEQRRRQQQLSLARDAELSALLAAGGSADANADANAQMGAARERHESVLREHSSRAAAADAAWASHLRAAKERLRVRDEKLIAAEGETLCVRVGTTLERLCAEPAYTDLSRKGLTAHDADVAATLLRTLPPLASVQALVLSGNAFGDAGMGALADACLAGALPAVERLFLDSVAMSDGGLTAFARALESGAMPELTSLDLTRNRIGNGGMGALARAFRSGALAKLRTLYLYNNRIGSDGLLSLAEAFCALETPPALERLYLDNNLIRTPGVEALCAAIDAGRLPCLTALHLSGNTASPEVVRRAVESVQRQQAEPCIPPTPPARDVIEAPPVE